MTDRDTSNSDMELCRCRRPAIYEYDDQYLFRLASTFGWDEVIALCASLAQDIEVAATSSSSSQHHRGERPRSDADETRGQQQHDDDGEGYYDDDYDASHNDEHYHFNDSICFFNGNDEHYNDSDGNNKLVLGGGIAEGGIILGSKQQNSTQSHHLLKRRHHHCHDLRQCLRRAHSQLYYLDQWGNTPLHAASYVKPPLRVIEELFRVGRLLWKYNGCYYLNHDHWPNTAQQGGEVTMEGEDFLAKAAVATVVAPIWARVCKDGSTPFLVACSTGATLSVLHCYLDEIEYYIEQRWIPSISTNYAKMAVLLPDNQGNTPIMEFMSFHHNWITRNSSNEYHGLLHINGNSAPPLRWYWSFACRMLRFATMEIVVNNRIPSSPSALSAMEEDDSTIALVHCCASIACYCPVSLLEWVVSLPPRYTMGDANDRGWFPGDVCAATKDDGGKLPFHRALEGGGMVYLPSTWRSDHEKTSFDSCSDDPSTASSISRIVLSRNNAHLKLERNRLHIIQKLLRWYPPAASTVLPNGRSPLVHAIAHGGAWHGIDSAITTTSITNKGANEKYHDAHLGLLQLICRHSPEQSLEIDPVSRLYPFMLAATVELYEEIVVVENVYNLLRQDPQVISLGISCS